MNYRLLVELSPWRLSLDSFVSQYQNTAHRAFLCDPLPWFDYGLRVSSSRGKWHQLHLSSTERRSSGCR